MGDAAGLLAAACIHCKRQHKMKMMRYCDMRALCKKDLINGKGQSDTMEMGKERYGGMCLVIKKKHNGSLTFPFVILPRKIFGINYLKRYLLGCSVSIRGVCCLLSATSILGFV